MTYIAKVLGRTPAACYSKAWQLIHPEYSRKPKQPTPNYTAIIRELEKELAHAKNVAVQVNRHWEMSKEEVKELSAELKHAQECMHAIQLNMNQFYNYTKS